MNEKNVGADLVSAQRKNTKLKKCRSRLRVRPNIIICVLFFVLFNFTIVQASEIDLEGYLNDMKSYGNEIIPEIHEEGFVEELVVGNVKIDGEGLIERILNVFIKEVRTSMKLIFKILTICVFCAIIKNLQSSNENGVSEVAFYVCYLMITILIITSFMNVVELCKDTVKILNSFMIIYLTISGHIVVVSTLQPVLIGMITLISNIVSNVLIPIILISTILNIVSNISEEVDVSKIGALIKKSAMFVLELLLIIFVAILSLEGTLAANVDGVVAKTTKSIVSTTVPVVGKLLGDAADSVIGATSITKNAIRIYWRFDNSFNMHSTFYKIINSDDNF